MLIIDFFAQSSYCNDTYASAVGVNKQYVDTYLPKLFQSNLLCAGHESSEQGSCKGDSGGPLMQNKVGKQTSSNSKKVTFSFLLQSISILGKITLFLVFFNNVNWLKYISPDLEGY
jgi:hypothetical protein